MNTTFLLFLGVFASIYGSLYFYLFQKMRKSGVFSTGMLWAAGSFMVLMIFGPVFIPNSYFIPWLWVKMGIAYTVYCSMGFVVIFFSWSLILSVVAGSACLIVRIWRGWKFQLMSSRQEFFLHFGVACIIFLYGLFEAMTPRLENVCIRDGRIPAGEKIRIVVVADIHLGVLENLNRLRNILDLVKGASPDLLLCVGDLTDSEIHGLSELSGMLGEIRPPRGKIAVLGNHEFYTGLPEALKFLSDSGFDTLRGETREVTPFLSITGFDDPTGVMMGRAKPASETEILSAIDRSRYSILLRHQPILATGTLDLFDLQISGHTHGGQIFPYYYFTRLVFNFPLGLSRLGERSFLYLSRGSSTFGPPLRVFCPPEVTAIDLVPMNP